MFQRLFFLCSVFLCSKGRNENRSSDPSWLEEVPPFSDAGLHMVDCNLALDDLINLMRIKAVSYCNR